MNADSYSNGMNGSTDLRISEKETATRPAPWEGDWRLAIAEERVAMAQARLAATEQRLRELVDFTNRQVAVV